MKNIAIVGAGLSGLTAAYFLKNIANITVFEKSRGVSGRMSTRRAGPYSFDHGAQYFTVREPIFQNFIEKLKTHKLIERWNARYVEIDRYTLKNEQKWGIAEPRYIGVPGMNSIAKFLVNGVNIKLKTMINQINYNKYWRLKDSNGNIYDNFDYVVLAIPSVQSIELLPIDFKYFSLVNSIEMEPCFALMLGLEEKHVFPYDCARIYNSDISWLSIDNSKPVRSTSNSSLIVHSTSKYAQKCLYNDSDEIITHLIELASKILKYDFKNINYKSLHKWMYANNIYRKLTNPIFFDGNYNLALCGDWCLGGRVEGAFMSGYYIAQKFKLEIL
jgi:predicted NAD/FAD-dependent oxidoreductase